MIKDSARVDALLRTSLHVAHSALEPVFQPLEKAKLGKTINRLCPRDAALGKPQRRGLGFDLLGDAHGRILALIRNIEELK